MKDAKGSRPEVREEAEPGLFAPRRKDRKRSTISASRAFEITPTLYSKSHPFTVIS